MAEEFEDFIEDPVDGQDAPEETDPDSGLIEALKGEIGGDEVDEEEDENPLVEVEVDGKKYKVPADLKDSYLRHADYTQKTQSLAEQRRAFEQEREQIQRGWQVSDELRNNIAHLQIAQKSLEQYRNVDWNAFTENDPEGAQRAFRDYTLMKDNIAQAERLLEGQVRQAIETNQQNNWNLRNACIQRVKQEDPTWTDSTMADVEKFYGDVGGDVRELQGTVNPVHLKVVRDAMQYRKLLSKVKGGAKKEKAPAKPAGKVGGAKSGSTRRPEELSIDDWVKQRNAEIAARNK